MGTSSNQVTTGRNERRHARSELGHDAVCRSNKLDEIHTEDSRPESIGDLLGESVQDTEDVFSMTTDAYQQLRVSIESRVAIEPRVRLSG
jgi:hypothetical protein